jgi:murein DD-endopeptidase MepM/ murein hydrolase activator NlpD
MFRKNKHITFYYADKHLQISEIKWFRLKLLTFIIGTVIVCLSIILTVNYAYNNFLGLGHSKLKDVMKENKLLQEQIVTMTAKMQELETTIHNLAERGNELRLSIDLPAINEEVEIAGTGGANVNDEFSFSSSNGSLVLGSAQKILDKLTRDVKVQEQSYAQVIEKYEFNKKYFTSIPALKPMQGFYSKNSFGMRIHPILGIKKMHEGIDIINDVGTPVVATGDGVVQLAGHSGSGYGLIIVINHGYGFQTIYAHLSKILVKEGQRVKRGEMIAKSGRSGLVNGPHLHYEVRRNGVCQNPIDYFFDDISIEEYRKQFAEK